MLRFVITLFFVGTCVANLDNLWTTFKSLHKRNYSAKEDSLRKSIFESSIKHVNEHNLHYDLGLSSYRLGLNKFADMTSDEFLQYKGLQFNASAMASSSGPSQSIVSADNLPAKVDWRDKGYVTAVKNQKQCGSCWAFSAVGALEGANAAKTGTLVSLSEQQLVDCSSKYGNQGCNGGMPNNAFKYIKDNGGLYTEQDYAYTARDGTCHTGRGQKTTCTGYVDIPRANEIALQQAVATKGPVAVCIDASRSSFQFYNGGVYDERFCSSTNIDHAVLVVGYGYDTITGKDYWLVKNSWDTNWGERGYIRMARNKNNQCAIASYASYPTV